jgi:hypothetical protein
MRSDIDIKRDVEAELQANPDIDSTDIAVAVKSGVVTLSGYVRSYMQRWEAEKTAKRVTGVVAVANDIEVRLPIFNQRPDPEVAREAVPPFRTGCPTRRITFALWSGTAGSRWKVPSNGTISANGRKTRFAISAASKGSSTSSSSSRESRPVRSNERSRKHFVAARRSMQIA